MKVDLLRFTSRDNTLEREVLIWCYENFGESGTLKKGHKWNQHHQPSQGRIGKYWIDIYDESMKTAFWLRWA